MQTLQSLRELFEATVELPAAARSAFLDERCHDAALRERVERMLIADAGGKALFTGGVRVAVAAIGDEETAIVLPPGTRIGPFELVAVLGEGGSSTVFHAQREFEGVQQQVALKVLRRGLYSPEAQRQFRRERQALAQLRHPGIARLIEGGVAADGLAYIALDLVEGKPIVEYAREHRLDLGRRLALFLQVCRAVEAAHRALIVHRDLKPSNVLVTEDGQVKLLDFGIAKLLDSDDETRTGMAAFTPAYAAPEQRFGGLVTTATDVYALGVLLGELVTGQRLAGGSGRTPSSQITGEEGPGVLPAPPSLTRRAVRGDLDNIVLKAIELESERRYASAGALADDIERMLDGRPVAAHPPSRLYRARKFVQRHRGAVAASALFLVAILAALALALWQADVARREASRANLVRDFLVGVFDAARAELPRDERPTPDALVSQAQHRLAGNSALDATTRGDLLRTLGEVSLSLSNFTQADDLFTQAQSLAAAQGDAAAESSARVLHAAALQRSGRNREAKQEIESMLATLRAAPSPVLLRALSVLAASELATGAPDLAIAHQREAAAAAESLYGPGDIEAIAVAFEIGNALSSAQRYPEARASLEPLIDRWRAIRAPEDQRYVAALTSLATSTDAVGDKPGSEARYRELLASAQRIYKAPHDLIAKAMRNLALIILRSEKFEEAESLLNQALAMQRQILGDDHQEVAATYAAFGALWVEQRRFAEADAAYRSAIAICERTGLREEVCPRAHNNLGMSLYRQDRLDEAKAEMQQALAGRRALFGDDHATVAYSLSTLANVAVKQNDSAEAVRLSGEALAVLERGGRGASHDGALLRNNYASALWHASRTQDALLEIDRTLEDWRRVEPNGKARLVSMLALKAQIQRDLKLPDDARATALEALAVGAPASELPPQTKDLLRELSERSDVFP
ncbi:MAG TPA: serine/threonine-protein kinase [Rhodanobacteraceae bacterium]|jgi:serine/threonine-protein kinase|nr:serine/threonine-protein kinase [Rhodanobacteraceae bacterium]